MGFFKKLFSGKEPSEEERESKRDANNFDVLKFNGIQAYQTGRLAHAIAYLTHALDIKEDEEAHVALVNAYIRNNDIEQAVEEVKELCELYPAQVNHPLTLAHLLYQLERYDEMDEACEHAISLDANRPTPYYLLAEKHLATDDLASAESNATRAVELRGDSNEPYLLRAQIYKEEGKYADALADIDQLLTAGDVSDDVQLLRGELLELTNKTEEALSSYKEVIAENPFNHEGYVRIASLQIQSGDYVGAEETISDAIEQNGEYAQIIQLRSDMKRGLGDAEGADADAELAANLLAEEEVAQHKEGNIEQEIQDRYNSINPFQ